MVWVRGILLLALQSSARLRAQEPSECFTVNGADYRGPQNHTAPDGGGQPCLYWNQTQKHAYNTAKYPNGEWGLGSHNACRNPDGDVQPWCYVLETEEGIYWKYCDIPTCHMPGYIGCFLDSGNPPTLSGSSGTSSKLTIQVCLQFCRKRGYKFAGVEAGCACFCGSEGDLQGAQPVGAVECDQVCFGKASELCGGDGRIGVYDVSVGACQGNFSAPSGVVYSPDFPDDYGPDSNCSWLLHPPAASAVELRFHIFEIRDPNDQLELWDGHSRHLLARFDGHHRPSPALLLPTNNLILSFRSDQLLHAQGFAVAYRGVKGPMSKTSEVDSQTLPSALVPPTSTERFNSSRTRGVQDVAVGAGGWMMYTASGAFLLMLLILSYHLRKRTCLFVQKKSRGLPSSFSALGPRCRCQCLAGEAWAVAYRHTDVLICTGHSSRRPALHPGSDDEAASDCACLCHSFENLTPSSQSSLKSLLSTS
ncbi:kremen protein 2 [Carettochelys insculpta]|uniref:kremen protein 2 n=1 Tax=Carettochelys insculpta TaxID=44489 RepID=UPI003EBF280F